MLVIAQNRGWFRLLKKWIAGQHATTISWPPAKLSLNAKAGSIGGKGVISLSLYSYLMGGTERVARNGGTEGTDC